MSKLTIIIPLLEQSDHLKECLQSIKEQKLHTIEVVLVIDKEEKDAQDLKEQLEQYRKEYAPAFSIKVIFCQEEHGIAAARNAGLKSAGGEYVMFMEAEDLLEKDTVNAMLEAVPSLPVSLVYVPVRPLHRLATGYHEEYEEEVQLLHETEAGKLSKRPAMDQAEAAFCDDPVRYFIETRDNLEDFSVLGCMFNRNFLKENDILFENEIKLYPDAPFLCNVLVNIQESKAVKEGQYIRRKGTFRYTETLGADWKEQLLEYMKSYDKAYSYCISNMEIMALVQETMCARYVNVVIRQICKSKDAQWQQELYSIFANQMKRVDKRVVACFDKHDRKHLTLLLRGDLAASVAYMRKYIRARKREHIFKKKNNFIRSVAEHLFGGMDILDRYIVFESGKGQRFYGDPKYIYEYLQKNYPGEYRCIWVVSDREMAKRIDGRCIKVKRFSLRYYYYILRAKYWIKDTRQPIWWYKSKEQCYISTWLGTPMQKAFYDKPAFLNGPAALKRGLKAQVDQWDYAISGNEATTRFYESALQLPKEKILQIGNPRNDLLLAEDAEERKEKIKAEMGLPEGKKTILYAPVWREEEETDVADCYKMQLGLYRMKEQLEDDYVVLIRIHDYITGKIVLDKALEGFVYDFSFYDDMQELLLVSDILITDYSSIIFDYACTKRPMFFYLYDYEQYEKNHEYFYYDMTTEKAPGMICHTTQEIINAIRDLSHTQEEYQENYEAFCRRFCDYTYGSAERLARKVFEEMKDIYEYEDENE